MFFHSWNTNNRLEAPIHYTLSNSIAITSRRFDLFYCQYFLFSNPNQIANLEVMQCHKNETLKMINYHFVTNSERAYNAIFLIIGVHKVLNVEQTG